MLSTAQSSNYLAAEDSIIVNIVIPRTGIHAIRIPPSSPISSLSTRFPDQQAEFIFHEQVLRPHHTLDFYNVKTGDFFVLISRATPSAFGKQSWLKLTEESGEFNEIIRVVQNQNCKSEVMRLRDLRMLRMEGKAKSFRKVCGITTRLDPTFDGPQKTVIPDHASIGHEPIPIVGEASFNGINF
jgi:hypothetical protein